MPSEPPRAKVVDNWGRQRYEIVVGDEVAGFVTYSRKGDRLVLVHTEIDAAFEGRGLGSVLVKGVLEDLRARALKAEPQCPFVKGYLERHHEYDDVVGR